MPFSQRCLVLGYHEIAPLETESRRSLVVSPRNFASHLAYLKAAGGECISLDHLAGALHGVNPLPRRSFAITFDDGYVGIERYAAPLLHKHGFPATVFVPSGLIGQRAESGDIPPMEKMNAAALRTISERGISIGAHTRSHSELPTLTMDEQRHEIEGCRHDLEILLERPVTTFAYPYGHFDDRAVEQVKQAGFSLACTTRYAYVGPGQDPFLVPRILIGEDLSLPFFIYRLWKAARVPVWDVGVA